jgi:hypothetical membrane protein
MLRTTSRDRAVRLAGVLLFAAGAGILMGIITAEALYPAAYSTSGNTISDLGATLPPDSVSYQPSAAIFDVTMIVTGLLILAAAWFGHRAFGRRTATAALTCYGLGAFGIGVFPGDTSPHPYVALFVFVAAGVSGLAVAGVVSRPFRHVSMTLGTITLGSIVLGFLFLDRAPVAALGEGGIERWIAYPAVLWLVVFGGWLMNGSPARAGHGQPDEPAGQADRETAVHPADDRAPSVP